MRFPILFAAVFLIVPLAGCLGGPVDVAPAAGEDVSPVLGYVPPEPDAELTLVQEDHWLDGEGGVQIHVRVVRPAGAGPFPVIAQFTPYTAPGQNVILNGLAEPTVGCTVVPVGVPGVIGVTSLTAGCEGTFDWQFVRRGYAFAYADVRGTGDSSGCLDLRGRLDIADAGHLTRWLGIQSWSNGNVGFIGASYPGSEAHMAGLAGDEHLKAIVPVVASTSFYHYHHNDGVPYDGNHALGGTNTGYSRNAAMFTWNPQSPNYATRLVDEAQCPHHENILTHGGLDQSGAYYDWWQERNLRPHAGTVKVPVLMAQGLADWNVKPDHIATWFNDLTVPKTLIAGQWGHAYPYSPCAEDQNPNSCDARVPYGDWWHYVNAFFDTHLKGIDTGMFTENVAWVQDSTGTWHRSADWPLGAGQADGLVLHFGENGTLTAERPAAGAQLSWYACGDDQFNRGHNDLETIESAVAPCEPESDIQELVFETAPFATDLLISGVPLVDLTLRSTAESTHLVVLVEVLDANGTVVQRNIRGDVELTARENYGYLNTLYRSGLESPQTTSGDYNVTIDLYPQEDVVHAGERLRITLRSDDGGRTIEAFPSGTNTLLVGPDAVNRITLPLRPLDLQGVRLPQPADA